MKAKVGWFDSSEEETENNHELTNNDTVIVKALTNNINKPSHSITSAEPSSIDLKKKSLAFENIKFALKSNGNKSTMALPRNNPIMHSNTDYRNDFALPRKDTTFAQRNISSLTHNLTKQTFNDSDSDISMSIGGEDVFYKGSRKAQSIKSAYTGSVANFGNVTRCHNVARSVSEYGSVYGDREPFNSTAFETDSIVNYGNSANAYRSNGQPFNSTVYETGRTANYGNANRSVSNYGSVTNSCRGNSTAYDSESYADPRHGMSFRRSFVIGNTKVSDDKFMEVLSALKENKLDHEKMLLLSKALEHTNVRSRTRMRHRPRKRLKKKLITSKLERLGRGYDSGEHGSDSSTPSNETITSNTSRMSHVSGMSQVSAFSCASRFSTRSEAMYTSRARKQSNQRRFQCQPHNNITNNHFKNMYAVRPRNSAQSECDFPLPRITSTQSNLKPMFPMQNKYNPMDQTSFNFNLKANDSRDIFKRPNLPISRHRTIQPKNIIHDKFDEESEGDSDSGQQMILESRKPAKNTIKETEKELERDINKPTDKQVVGKSSKTSPKNKLQQIAKLPTLSKTAKNSHANIIRELNTQAPPNCNQVLSIMNEQITEEYLKTNPTGKTQTDPGLKHIKNNCTSAVVNSKNTNNTKNMIAKKSIIVQNEKQATIKTSSKTPMQNEKQTTIKTSSKTSKQNEMKNLNNLKLKDKKESSSKHPIEHNLTKTNNVAIINKENIDNISVKNNKQCKKIREVSHKESDSTGKAIDKPDKNKTFFDKHNSDELNHSDGDDIFTKPKQKDYESSKKDTDLKVTNKKSVKETFENKTKTAKKSPTTTSPDRIVDPFKKSTKTVNSPIATPPDTQNTKQSEIEDIFLKPQGLKPKPITKNQTLQKTANEISENISNIPNRLSNGSNNTELSNMTDMSMRPSFIKRKLFTQTLDLLESAPQSPNASANSPLSNVYNSQRNSKKSLAARPLLMKDVFDENTEVSNIRDMIEKIIPGDKVNLTTVSQFNFGLKTSLSKEDVPKTNFLHEETLISNKNTEIDDNLPDNADFYCVKTSSPIKRVTQKKNTIFGDKDTSNVVDLSEESEPGNVTAIQNIAETENIDKSLNASNCSEDYNVNKIKCNDLTQPLVVKLDRLSREALSASKMSKNAINGALVKNNKDFKNVDTLKLNKNILKCNGTVKVKPVNKNHADTLRNKLNRTRSKDKATEKTLKNNKNEVKKISEAKSTNMTKVIHDKSKAEKPIKKAKMRVNIENIIPNKNDSTLNGLSVLGHSNNDSGLRRSIRKKKPNKTYLDIQKDKKPVNQVRQKTFWDSDTEDEEIVFANDSSLKRSRTRRTARSRNPTNISNNDTGNSLVNVSDRSLRLAARKNRKLVNNKRKSTDLNITEIVPRKVPKTQHNLTVTVNARKTVLAKIKSPIPRKRQDLKKKASPMRLCTLIDTSPLITAKKNKIPKPFTELIQFTSEHSPKSFALPESINAERNTQGKSTLDKENKHNESDIRKRGRPKKHSIAEMTILKKRGRPKKNVLTEKQDLNKTSKSQLLDVHERMRLVREGRKKNWHDDDDSASMIFSNASNIVTRNKRPKFMHFS